MPQCYCIMVRKQMQAILKIYARNLRQRIDDKAMP